jgi:hypothetical protein
MLIRRIAAFLVPFLFVVGAGRPVAEERVSAPPAIQLLPAVFTKPGPLPERPPPIQVPPTDEVPRWLVARPRRPNLRTWHHPDLAAQVGSLSADNVFGQRMSFAVVDRFRDGTGVDWVRIRTGEHPNGARAWVRMGDVRLRPARQQIVVDLSARRLVWFIDGEVRTRLSVAVGDQDTPTAPGRYFVWARVRFRNHAGPYGKLALGLSGFSEVVRFGPAPGRLAIHGTADPSDRGRSVSLGCVRVYNGEIGKLWGVPMGTPVIIRP